jgi:DNA-directed RNA polymerase alpha subunit
MIGRFRSIIPATVEGELATPIDALDGLSIHAYRALKKAGVKTIGDLIKFTRYEVVDKIPGFGPAAAESARKSLGRIGLTFRLDWVAPKK